MKKSRKKLIIMEGDIGSSFASIKIPLTLSSEQEKIIDSQSLLANKLYNLLIEEVSNEYLAYCEAIKNTRPEYWKDLTHPINAYNIRNKVPVLKDKYPVLKSVYSDILKNIGFNVAENWQSYLSKRKSDYSAKPPTFTDWKEKFCNLTYLYDKSAKPSSNGFCYDNTTKSFTIKLGYKEVNGNPEKLNLTIPVEHLFLKKFNQFLKKITIGKNKQGYYIDAVFNLPQENYEKKYKIKSVSKISSLDLNHKNLAHVTTSSGQSYEIKAPTKLKWFKKQISLIEEKLQNKEKKDSRSSKRLEKAKRRLNYKMREQMKHFIGFASNTLIRENDNIVIGDYVPSPTEIKNINKSIINDSNLAQFRMKLKSKCIRYAKGFEIVNEKNTTRECSYCNFNNGKIEVKIREFRCKSCGEELNRDENSSFNIMKKSEIYKNLKSKHILPLSIKDFQERGYCLRFNNRGYEVIKYQEKYYQKVVGNVDDGEVKS
jgi:putative transposase